jgi:hypothetical protein
MKTSILLMTPTKTKLHPQTQKVLAAFLIAVLFLFSLRTIQGTLGKFLHSLALKDSASVAKFDVTVTAPDEFLSEHGKNVFEYHFLSGTDIQGLNFQVHNSGETDILCTPKLSNDVTYRIYVSESECSEFIVRAKESADFWLIIAPNGLDANIKDAELLVDIRQVEGG